MTEGEISNAIPFVALGAAAITGLFTVLGVVLSSRASREQLKLRLDQEEEAARREALRTRLEELYHLTDKWARNLILHHVLYRRVMEGEITYNQALDIELQRDVDIDASRLIMLAELYFTESHEKLMEIREIQDEAARIQTDFKERYRGTGEPSEPHAKGITRALERFNKAVDEYKTKLCEYARYV